ncbi:MAG: hypothetical protein ACRD5H_04145 [Nitrososphaerales archaeon]
MSKERTDRKGYWESELKSLGVEPRRQCELNDREELQSLVENIKKAYYQDYKTAYNEDTQEADEILLAHTN